MKKVLLFTLLVAVFAPTFTHAQQKTAISLEDIWQDYKFFPKRIPGFNFQNDGKHYTRQEKGKIQQYDLTTGKQTITILDAEKLKGRNGFSGNMDSYEFSADEDKMMITSETESIYRHSSRSNFWVWDKSELWPVYEDGKVRYATFNPKANKVAFVFDNDLYIKDLATMKVTQITTDGKQNEIINGATDWVYEEEFTIWKGFEWSPDGNKLAYYRFDETAVKEFTMTNYNDEMYPEYVTFKYPKVGEKNSEVSIHIYNLETLKTATVDLGDKKDMYVPRIKWSPDPNQLVVFHMNRHQNELELLMADGRTGKTTTLLKEENKYYIDIHDNLTFLKGGKQFVWTSEKSGYNHIYLHTIGGKIMPLTQGEWEVTDFYGIDEANGMVYYQAAKEQPQQREIYGRSLKGKKEIKLAKEAGWNGAQFSSTHDYYVLTHSTANKAPTYGVYDRSGKLVRSLEDNHNMAQLQSAYNAVPLEFFDFKTSEGVDLNGYMIKPNDFDANKKYPVFMYLYGGPGSQQVTDSWKGQNYWWFQMLAQQGYIVACVDNRGTGGRGEEFKKMTYQNLGHFETIDQIEAAKYLGNLKYTDKNRVGIFGWSYGGYMSSLCLLKGNDVFKAAIAVAPVTSWKWYDSIYTERYMRTLEENPAGYADNSPVYFADRLKGNYLLVHGMGDDNVHFQHTAEMANALIKANKQYDTYFYPNRNHGIHGGVTRLHLYQKMTDFLQDNLMEDTAPVGEDKTKP